MGLRVLQVSHAWEGGGSALYASALAGELARQGLDVERFGPSDARAPPPRGFTSSFRNPAADAAFTDAVRGVQVVHIHHLAQLSFDLPRIARQAGAAVVLTLHDYFLGCARGQLVDVHGQRCAGWETTRCARCLAPHLYAPLPAAAALRLPPRRAPVNDRVAAWEDLRRHVDWVYAPSGWTSRRMGMGGDVLPLPLLSPIRPAPAAPPGPVRFLVLGSLIPTKGADVALAAFASLPPGSGTLRFVGGAPAWNGSTAWADALVRRMDDTPSVSRRLQIPHADVETELHAADVLLLPSQWEENAPLVLIEAAAAGLRILASDLGGVAETAPSARLVEAGSVAAWRAALADEVRRGRARTSPLLRDSLGEHSARIARRYDELVKVIDAC